MKKTLILIAIAAAVIFFSLNSEWIAQLRNENLSYFTDDLFSEIGYGILFITIPLMIIQNIVTIFPILIVIIIHFILFGLAGGFLYSLIGTTIGAIVCFWLGRTASRKWVDKYWSKNEEKLSYIVDLISSYGVFMIVVLRSIPVMPSNLISIAASVSPISDRQYIWSTLFGNISMVWILSLLSSPLWMSESIYTGYITGYIIFALAVTGYYGIRFYRHRLNN
ncbi:TVP38/TMEM64 family protein [Salipaludibacillus aurantiacus]|uniref:TVP38/TMEM64 family membrane protein n=1 Tax=Salipaludibacillus aurantiacus TaxID=1601833 RepID=A0A1H9WDC0_9BACI|nr:VTT domain-containing protein [Salipaludibacillus aurantiacus]SES31936.1 Uncharacterized membrane protein YdjX, TVP38/TMEM64 family, SNARE-associated domain [Salipaludibacillus aurantiacus]